MSQANVERWRASIENARAGIDTGEFDREATISKTAEFYDPEIEWDASGALVLDTIGVYRGIEAVRGQIFDFREGKIARVRTYLDHGEALKAAGLER